MNIPIVRYLISLTISTVQIVLHWVDFIRIQEGLHFCVPVELGPHNHIGW